MAQPQTLSAPLAAPAPRARRWRRRAAWLGAALAVLLLLAAAGVALAVRASLARTEGELALPGLAAPVRVSRDARGVPTVRGESLSDVVAALGFLYAQERFFQMDLARRYSAGELAALLGDGALAADRRLRPYRLRPAARRILGELPAEHRQLLAAYAAGVNAGLADLGARPPEYLLLRAAPEPWLAEDAVLAQLYFFLTLSVNDGFERPLGVMAATLPPELVAFLTPDTSRFDAPLLGGSAADPSGGYRPLSIPGPEVVDLRGSAPSDPGRDVVRQYGDLPAGSNNWALAGWRTAHGGAIVANDPHLGLGVPNVWYRVDLAWPGHRVRGVTAAGLPGVVIGSSERVAWGMTNGMADQVDLVVVEVDPADPGRYRVGGGSEPFSVAYEPLAVAGGAAETLEVRATRWGPVVAADWQGRPLAWRSPVHDPGGIDVGVLDLMRAEDAERAVVVARGWKGPSLNLVLGDRDGHIAWVLSGFLPARRGFDGKWPRSWADGSVGWDGPLPEDERPVLVDPPSGVLFTANQRTVGTPASHRLSRVWTQPTRAFRLAELLAAQRSWNEAETLAVQLDTRSVEHDAIRDLVLATIPADDPDAVLRRVRQHVAAWDGTAGADQVGFRLLQRTAEALREAVLVPLLAPALAADPDLRFDWPLAFEPALRILEERPAHLLPPGHASWNGLVRSTLRQAARRPTEAIEDLDRPWGEVNRAGIRHPLSRAVRPLAPWLDMPDEPLPGWPGVLRTQAPGYGASLRLVAAPGHLERALFHMPGGQSGHPLSPFYRRGHRDWVEGRPTPLLPGKAVTRFTLRPAPLP
ncbi:MAG TPA: penicillin acylase family protein [Thermoanaerobaculia bacterium]|nr:penicillin acylase family protein [Thermoanaerobaculia bacterium]